jgi:squalene-associated FAD-dependent desaturase
VIGAGFAGLSAAVRLVRDGARVVVFESRARLGGRATAFQDRDTGELVDNGQHVLLGCYTDTLAFLGGIGALENVRRQPQLSVTMIDRAGHRTRLECPRLPAPLHLLAGVLDWEALSWRDRWSVLGMLAPLRVARREARTQAHDRLTPGEPAGHRQIAASPGETVTAWLVRNGQTARVREMLWEPLALAALNQPASEAAAPVFARVLAEMFGADPQAASIVLPTRPLHAMYAEPARAFIESRGSDVRMGSAAVVSVDGEMVSGVSAGGEMWKADAVISAVPWFALGDLFEHPPEIMRPILERSRALAASPIVTVNLWFDRRVMDERFIGLPGRHMQWVFDKGLIFEASDGVSHLSLVSSGASPLVDRTNAELVTIAHREVIDALPEARSAALVRATVIREPRATFSLAPGQPARPGTLTPIRGFYLAGDWIETGLPATIESAVRSGHRAAGAVKSGHG